MKRYAFIDVPNTKGSGAILGFKIAPQNLINYLKDEKWSCTDVYWYNGRIYTEKREMEREALIQMGYTMRDKDAHFLKQKGTKIPKANCDVELTVDCMELAGIDTEFLIFTGDGDFRYLIKKLIEKGVTVRLFSTTKADSKGDFRFSTRLKSLVHEHEVRHTGSILFTELNNIRNRIGINFIGENELGKTKGTATKRDGSER